MATIRELFADATTTEERVNRFDQYQAELKKSQADQRARQRVADNSDIYESARAKLSKSLSAEEMAAISMSLGEMNGFSKDITAGAYPTAGFPGNFQPYDLSGPAKVLVPVTTPIRNQTPREQGQGGAAEFRVITGFSNAGVGGINDLNTFFNSETTTTSFGSLSLRRPQKIEYGYLDKITAYVEMGLSDSVTEKAYFSALGFDNLLSVSQTALLHSHMIAEEKALLFGRGATAQGYAGPFNGGTGPAAALTVAAGSAGSAPGSTFAGTVFVNATYRAGVGETGASANQASAVTIAAGQAISVTMPSIPAGAFGVTLYVNIVSQSAGSFTVGTIYQAGTYSGGLTGPILINPASIVLANSVAALPTDNTSANGFDGLLTIGLNPALSGYANSAAGSIATNGDAVFQAAFVQMYLNNRANPQQVWVDPVVRSNLQKWLRSSGGGAAEGYRLSLSSGEVDGVKVGAAVTGLVNGTTGRMTELCGHPYLPPGTAVILTTAVEDMPQAHLGSTIAVRNVADYRMYEWPVIQMTRDASTWQLGTLIHYAPGWNGAIAGFTA